MTPTQAEIAAQRVVFNDAVALARASKDVDDAKESLIADSLKEFARIETEAASSNDEGLLEQAAILARRRAYILPLAELPVEGNAALAELREWRVPDAVVTSLQPYLDATVDGGDPKKAAAARAALLKIFEAYDYWDDYVNWYFSQQRKLLVSLLTLAGVALVGAIVSFEYGYVLFGFIVAGLSGSAISVVLKLPPLTVYGDAVSLVPRVSARLAAGVAASAIGCGLLASGVINVGFGMSDGDNGGSPLSVPIVMRDLVAEADTQRFITSMQPKYIECTGLWAQAFRETEVRPPTQAIAAQADGGTTDAEFHPQSESKTLSIPPYCDDPRLKQYAQLPIHDGRWKGHVNLMIMALLSLGLLFGFTERALSSFEEIVFKSPAPPPPPKGKS